jgi:hypothetical protein
MGLNRIGLGRLFVVWRELDSKVRKEIDGSLYLFAREYMGMDC